MLLTCLCRDSRLSPTPGGVSGRCIHCQLHVRCGHPAGDGRALADHRAVADHTRLWGRRFAADLVPLILKEDKAKFFSSSNFSMPWTQDFLSPLSRSSVDACLARPFSTRVRHYIFFLVKSTRARTCVGHAGGFGTGGRDTGSSGCS